jgi:hypothetical protein
MVLDWNLTEFLKQKLENLQTEKQKSTQETLYQLQQGDDSNYNRDEEAVYTYSIKHFLNHVYCSYVAWYYIYQKRLLPLDLTIVDIGAGPATVAFGLALLIESSVPLGAKPNLHISYYSLEKQKRFQFRGLQFWREYIESKQSPPNAYFRFVTKDILKPDLELEKLPKQFFHFIVLSHCFFFDSASQVCANHNYTRIIQHCLQPNGYVLLMIQNRKLFQSYDEEPSDDIEKEKEIVNKFLRDLGLRLVWYKYLHFINSRQPMDRQEFGRYARTNLHLQRYISEVAQEYFQINYNYSYTLDDYVILASYKDEI